MFKCHVREAIEEDTVEQNEINVSFTASKKSLNRNENLLKISLSSTKFRSKYRRVPRNFRRTIAEWDEISLELSRSAMKFRSNYRGFSRNIVVAQTIGLAKSLPKIAPNEISLFIVEYSRNSSNFVCITFAQYCRGSTEVTSPGSDSH